MKYQRRPKLFVECLEQRVCPSFVVRLFGGTLYVAGTPTAQTGAAVRFTQVANNQWQVIDGGDTQSAPSGSYRSLGKYNASNVILKLNNHQGAPVIFDLGTNTSAGNIFVDLGHGDNSNL